MTGARRILVVDDEPDMAELFRQQFRREIRKGVYEFRFAERGQEALDVLDGETPAVLLSDLNIPGMDGIELLERVKGLRPDLPVIMVTAYGDRGTTERVKGLGAETLVPKPVDFDLLKSTLSELVAAEGRR
ncbi:response regulator [Alphaproteobacteria bacterium GH1-50]|uniref:Response regulator n=1 Tax=Kangsaoukella pontilimi TaxID=2691042 RepID=A0A7C9MLF2_9RHOB|nr:response regulator [Kangsaoukella pontilimi]MXQ09195.1 response regulator [Kangsaoukella pontilimi]